MDQAASLAPQLLVVSPRTELATSVKASLHQYWPQASCQCWNSYPTGKHLQAWMNTGSWWFIDVEPEPAIALQTIRELSEPAGSNPVIAILTRNNPELILQSLRAGALDFLMIPFTKEEFQALVRRICQKIEVTMPGQARVILWVPGKGASGASTLCANLALLHPHWVSGQLLVMDLDPLAGTLGFLFNLKSNYSFLDALQRFQILDQELWRGLVVSADGFDVLLAPENPAEALKELADPTPLISFARQHYDVILIDCGGLFAPYGIELARVATEVILVTTNELTALEATQKGLAYLDEHHIDRHKVRLVINRYAEQWGLSRPAIAAALHQEVFAVIPSDYEAVQRSIVERKPVSSASPTGRAMLALAQQLGGRPAGSALRRTGKSWWNHLATRFLRRTP